MAAAFVYHPVPMYAIGLIRCVLMGGKLNLIMVVYSFFFVTLAGGALSGASDPALKRESPVEGDTSVYHILNCVICYVLFLILNRGFCFVITSDDLFISTMPV